MTDENDDAQDRNDFTSRRKTITKEVQAVPGLSWKARGLLLPR